jgi:hypothetical protein
MESYIKPQSASYDELDPQVFADTIQTVLYIQDYSQVSIDGLRNLESLAHDRDYGIKLVQPDTLDRLLKSISIFQSSESTQIRQCASRVIGSALWNNPEAVEVIKRSSLVKKLLDALEREPDSGVRASLIFALSAASAGDITDFLENNGSQLLRRIFLMDKPEVQGKCATFVEDNLANTAANPDELKLWCELFQNVLLEQQSLDVTSEKVLSALMYLSCKWINYSAIKRAAHDTFTVKSSFLAWLADNVGSKEHSDTMHELLKEGRHLFGNPKAARKTAWEDEPRPPKDEL